MGIVMAAAEKAAAEKAVGEIIMWELSESEKQIIKQLGKKNENNV